MWCVWAILGCATALSGNDSCDASVAAAPEFPGTTLSWEPRLFIYENFFNDRYRSTHNSNNSPPCTITHHI